MKNNYRIESLPRMFEQVSKQIVAHIDQDHLEPGEKLPPERQLSELLQVSRSSVRESIKVLELLRFLESRQGEGTFVASPPAFIIPSRVINKRLPMPELDHYFQVALMCGKTIVSNFLKSEEPLSHILYNHSFWENLSQLFSTLGEKITNPYYLSLWNESFHLLEANQYFVNKQHPFDWIELDTAIQKRDLQTVLNLLNLL